MSVHFGYHSTKNNLAAAFTLIELLTVIAVISLLLAILLPCVRKARTATGSVACRSNLRQIAIAWDTYLNDNDQKFLQGVNVNHDFGGWKGKGGFASKRALNKYLGLPVSVETEEPAKVFRCPADNGGIFGIPSQELAYHYFGNSYQTNILLVGPNRIGVPPDSRADLHREINKMLAQLSRLNVSDSSRLVLVGDNNWVSQWEAGLPCSLAWHGRNSFYNVAFLDGHVDSLKIHKGLYVTQLYRVQPFKSLDSLAYELQTEVPCN